MVGTEGKILKMRFLDGWRAVFHVIRRNKNDEAEFN